MGTFSKKVIAETIVRSKFEFSDDTYVLAGIDKIHYQQVLATLQKVTEPFVEVILDEAELSIVVKETVWQEHFAADFPDALKLAPLTKMFCNVDETVTGYLLTILGYFSPYNIGIYVQGAYTTDHIFVHSEDLDKARQQVQKLQQDMQAMLDAAK